MNVIFCFRAKPKVKLASKQEKKDGAEAVTPQGFCAIAGEEFIYEMIRSVLAQCRTWATRAALLERLDVTTLTLAGTLARLRRQGQIEARRAGVRFEYRAVAA